MFPKFSHLVTEAHRYTRAEVWKGHKSSPLANRIGRILVGETIHKLFFERFIDQFTGYQYLDSGNQAVVLRNDDASHVLKVLVNSNSNSERMAVEESRAYQQMADIAHSYLGDQFLDTRFQTQRIRTLPFLLPGSSVVAYQPFLPEGTKRIPVEEHLAEDPRIAGELLCLIKNIEAFHDDTGIYPDIRWPKNLVYVPHGVHSGFKIIDTNLDPTGSNMRKLIMAKGWTVEHDIALRLEEMSGLAEAAATISDGFRERSVR